MQPDPWQRWSPLAGVAYVIFFLAALGVSADGPGDTPEEFARYFADEGNRSAEFFVFFLLVAAALAFLWFLGALRGVLVRAERDPARWTALAFGAGVASATLLMASASLFLARAGAASQDEFAFDPATANMLTYAAYALLVCSTMSAAILVLATSIVGLRTGVLPRWTALAASWSRPCSSSRSSSSPSSCGLAWVLAVSIVFICALPALVGGARDLARRAEPDVEDVAVLDDVGLALEPLVALSGRL